MTSIYTISYSNLGSVFSEKGEYYKAIDYFEKALFIRLKAHEDHPSTSELYNNLGLVWTNKGITIKPFSILKKL